LCRPLFFFLSFCFLAIILSVCVLLCRPFFIKQNNTQTDNIMAKKQKDKKKNNGRHNNTQTNRQYNGKEKKR
jgi:uncharacterized protein YxeA